MWEIFKVAGPAGLAPNAALGAIAGFAYGYYGLEARERSEKGSESGVKWAAVGAVAALLLSGGVQHCGPP